MDKVTTGGTNYSEDIDLTYSTYATQMYMGFNDYSGNTRDCSGCRYWPGDTASSTVNVNFDTFNTEATTLTIDAALSGLSTATAAMVAVAAGYLF